MSTLSTKHPDRPNAGPSRRALGVLVIVVLAAHTLVLETTPKRFGPELDASSRRAQAFTTRRIEPPPSSTSTQAPPLEKPAAKQVKKAALKEQEVVAQALPAQPAIDLAAPQVPEPLLSDNPTDPSVTDGGPTEATAASAAAAIALAAASAASAAATPPIGPQQTPVTAMALPPSARLDYRVTGGAKGLNYYANAELAWHNAGNSYDARMTVSALFIGARTMASNGQVTAEGLAPTRFSDKFKSEVAAHFESDKGLITFSANTPSAAWIKGAQDRVSVFFQLAGMLAGNPGGFPVGSTITMYTVGPRDADSWTFLVETEEKINLPFGELATVKLSRQPRREYDQKVEIWYAPSLGYLPVRSKITQHNGDFVDQQLSAVGKS
ncbi:MAG: DUF3108 domain-containing protein [Polaromonas sp.]|uniref:DUF3108 domain-containing protein n=1 Tax=Polaromonas sp. TaxID=1869339 RepID=UPI0017AE5FF1|nr:DUF3108 domain-containing protein [Polaromonas sp.]NMM09621.1 DUF3108 domain-containing protein [Polaromonas sp.]